MASNLLAMASNLIAISYHRLGAWLCSSSCESVPSEMASPGFLAGIFAAMIPAHDASLRVPKKHSNIIQCPLLCLQKCEGLLVVYGP